MHEYSLVTALVESVEREARTRGASAVVAVRVALGRQAGVDADLLRTAFELRRAGTLCARAGLELRHVDCTWECRACGTPVAAERALCCPSCGAPARMVTGDEIVLERLELEVA